MAMNARIKYDARRNQIKAINKVLILKAFCNVKNTYYRRLFYWLYFKVIYAVSFSSTPNVRAKLFA